MPSRWEVLLPGIDPAGVRLEHLHAMVSGWFDHCDAEHHASAKPYTVCPPKLASGGTALEIALLHDELAPQLRTATAPGTRLRLGSAWSRLRHPPQPITTESWETLSKTDPASAWCLRFITPTTFRRGNAFTPSPCLRAILGSLRASWQQFAPAGLPPLNLALTPEPVWLTDIDVASHVTTVSGRTVSGFTGRLRFVSDDSDVAEPVSRLVALAPYAGVGAYTSRGFGMTRPEPTWPAPPTQRRISAVPART